MSDHQRLSEEQVQALRRWRESLGLSQGELGKRAGVPQVKLCRWECGYAQLSEVELMSVCDVLHARMRELQNSIPAGQAQVREIRQQAQVTA